MNPATEKNHALISKARTFKNIPWCEEYELMISGMLYNSFVPILIDGRFRARKVMYKFNNAPIPDDISAADMFAQRNKILPQLFGSIGKNSFIEPPLYVDYGCNISIGSDFYANFNTTILDCSLVTIGDRVQFGPNVSILTATHETGVQSRRDGVEFAKDISIGSDCWIGSNVTILAGVHIGEGCTIGAGAVVTRNIPAFSVAMGCSARVAKKVDPVPPIEE